ncbi:MAG: ABC transporter ATP-binding protein [Balneolaceae bacterium]
MISIQNLVKRYYGETVLNIPALEISKGECFGLVGNNGAGKTTLFRLILDLIRSTSGTVTLFGRAVHQTEDWKTQVGSYLDEHMLLPFLTPDEYFDMLREVYQVSPKAAEDRLRQFDPLFNDEIRFKKKYIRSLSKGNRKKTGIAAAFLSEPDLIILDEPFENLDPTSQNRLKKLITTENKNQETTFLISSHDLVHVTDICSRIVLLEKGTVVQDLSGKKEEMATQLNQYFDR